MHTKRSGRPEMMCVLQMDAGGSSLGWMRVRECQVLDASLISRSVLYHNNNPSRIPVYSRRLVVIIIFIIIIIMIIIGPVWWLSMGCDSLSSIGKKKRLSFL
jgi:hypothetical protein